MVRIVLLAVVFAMPVVASAQPWADAHHTGDYQKAADLLHAIVADSDQHPGSRDPDPFQHLALMYARGLGVAPDSIGACALAQMADIIAHMGSSRYRDDGRGYDTSIKESKAFLDAHCGHLSREDRLAAMRSLECYAFGMHSPPISARVSPCR